MFSIIPLSFDAPLQETPSHIRINFILRETTVTGPAIQLKFSRWSPKTYVFWNECVMARQGHPRVDFGTNRKRVCDLLLVINSNFGRILPVSDILQVFCWKQHPTPIPPEFRGVPLGLDCHVGSSMSEDPKLIIRVITFELTQHIRPRYINVMHRQTDGRTDELL